MYPNAEAVEETCRKLAATGMNAVLLSQASGLPITGSASGAAAALDPAQEAARHHLQSSAAKSTHPSSAATPHADDVDRPQSMTHTAVFAASSMQGSLHSKTPSLDTPSQTPPRTLLPTGSGCETTQETLGATCSKQEEGERDRHHQSASQGASQGTSQGVAHQVQASPSNAVLSEAGASQAADGIEAKESSQGSSRVWPVWQFCNKYLPSIVLVQ